MTHWIGAGRDTESQEAHAAREQGYEDGYRAGRIAALREVGCEVIWDGYKCADSTQLVRAWCTRCRLLAGAESGEDTGAQ